ncbi:uncharacterized protein LOC133247289 isoform X2 [Bos javanicus]|uniref:uncharacterized protein LOC133247289 isoform X2 n=1 Tax=Bos javanicus TaxID=9906 RepID=UPI002AA6CDA4|nr:uncharacterized protein LOC133247289 isoform X2 [Bos javanicus]
MAPGPRGWRSPARGRGSPNARGYGGKGGREDPGGSTRAISGTSFLPSNITTNQDAIRPGSSAHPSLGLAAGGERILSFHWLTATCMEIRMTGDSQRLLCYVDLWLTALKPASSEPELLGFFSAFSPCSSPKEISQTFPSAPLSEAQSESNSQKIRRICILFCIFFAYSRFCIKIFPLPSNAMTVLDPFSLPCPSKERLLSVWSPSGPAPCCLKPSLRAQLHQIPNCPLPPSQDPGASHNDLKPSLEGS